MARRYRAPAARPNPTWQQRPQGEAWSPEEDNELCAMIGCGLSVDYYPDALPGRAFGDILDRRMTLIDAGRAHRPAAI